MFNTTNVNSPSKEFIPYDKKVSITEHRAPTDESLRILNEMREKVKGDIVARVILNDNLFNVTAFIFRNDVLHDQYEWLARYTINGKEFTPSGKFEIRDVGQITFNHVKTYVFPDIIESVMAAIRMDVTMVIGKSYIKHSGQ